MKNVRTYTQKGFAPDPMVCLKVETGRLARLRGTFWAPELLNQAHIYVVLLITIPNLGHRHGQVAMTSTEISSPFEAKR